MIDELTSWITVKQYADIKDISVQAVYQSIKRKSLESKMIGKTVLVKAV